MCSRNCTCSFIYGPKEQLQLLSVIALAYTLLHSEYYFNVIIFSKIRNYSLIFLLRAYSPHEVQYFFLVLFITYFSMCYVVT